MFKPILHLFLAVFGLSVVLSANAATVLVSNGQIISALGVSVEGNLYNVTFIDGSCNELFNGCMDFAFATEPAAAAASIALSTVLIDGAGGLTPDSDPTQIRGCDLARVCNIATPYRATTIGGPPRVLTRGFFNYMEGEGEDDFSVGSYPASSSLDLAIHQTYAVWVSQVPIPASGWLLMSALAALVGQQRFSRRRIG